MIGSVLLVLITELLNSAIEWCVDLAAEQQRHPFAKRAKDMGSAAVFLSLVNCLMMWVLVLAQAAAGRLDSPVIFSPVICPVIKCLHEVFC